MPTCEDMGYMLSAARNEGRKVGMHSNLRRLLLANPRSPAEIRQALLDAGYVVDADVKVAEKVAEMVLGVVGEGRVDQ